MVLERISYVSRVSAFASIFLLVLLSGCSEERPAQLPDAEAEVVYARGEITNTIATVTLAEEPELSESAIAMQKFAVVAVKGAGRLTPLFENLLLPGTPGETFSIRFELDEYVLRAYRVQEKAKLNSFLQNLQTSSTSAGVQTFAGASDGVRIDLFSVRVERAGRLVARRNSLDEETYIQRLQDSPWESATHVQLSLNASARTLIGLDTLDAERTFHVGQLDGRVLSHAEFLKEFDVSLNKEQPEEFYYSQINGERIQVYRIFAKTDSQVRSDLRNLDSGESLISCPTLVAEFAESKLSVAKQDCVLKLHQVVGIQFVAFEGKTINNDDRYRSAQLRAVSVPQSRSNGFFQIPKNSAQNAEDLELCDVDPKNTLRVDDLRDAEFQFRRTLLDSPNRFPLAFAGLGANLEIVRFVFEEDRVVVRRNRALSPHDSQTELDLENLISLRAKYFRLSKFDSKGQKLSHPRCVEASPNESGAIARIDWTQNEFPTVASPLAYYWVGQCFAREGPQEVRDVDARLNAVDGVLNFTLESNYSLNPRLRCTNQWLISGFAEYWYPTQTNFTFRERVSFRRHDGRSDSIKLPNIPYFAQKRLNYGVFTFSKPTPNQYGNTGMNGTEEALPMLFPFQAGKKLTYILKGIPEEGELREKLIAATEEVIQDWNLALKRAFDQTDLAREQDYISLLVEGRDAAAIGELGDLDKNFIYYVKKATGSWILGMAGPSPNPRSGSIENSNVLIYGGNMRSYLEYAIKMARAKQEYQDNMRPVQAEASTFGARDGNTRSRPENSAFTDAVGGSKDENSTENVFNLREAGEGSFPGDGQSHEVSAISERLNRTYDVEQVISLLTSEFGGQISPDNDLVHFSSRDPLIDARKSDLESILSGGSFMRDHSLSSPARRTEFELIKNIYERGVEEAVLTDEFGLQAVVNQEVMKFYEANGGLTEDQRLQLAAESSKEGFTNELIKTINDGPTTIETMSMGHGVSLLTGSLEDALADSFRKTLTHEIGHALGLRHNFLGSFDKENWIHTDEIREKRRIRPLSERKKHFIRNYSSVMDYMPNSEIEYEGPGPWDVYALRSAYTGMIELDEDFSNAVNLLNGEEVRDPLLDDPIKIESIKSRTRKLAESAVAQGLKTVAGKYVHFSEIFRLNDIKEFTDLRQRNLSKTPTKDILYCSDESVYLDPLCNRHDMGTTPREVVARLVDEYQSYYSLRNFPNDRLDFTWLNERYYIWRTLFSFVQIRHFLDAVGFEIARNKDDVTKKEGIVPESAQFISTAAAYADNFFHSVIRTPEASIFLNPEDRFAEAELIDGRVLKYEKKWTKGQIVPEEWRQLRIRGIAIDKAIATLFLTVRRLGIPEYERTQVRISFPNLERAMYSDRPMQDLPTIKLLTEVLSNNLRPGFLDPDGELQLIDDKSVRTYSDELNRFYAAWGGVMALDTYSLEAEANFGALFRIGSSVGENSSFDLPVLTQLGESPQSFGSMKMWLYDRSHAAERVFNQAAFARITIENFPRFVPLLVDYFNLKMKLGVALRLQDENESITGELDSTFKLEVLRDRIQRKRAVLEEAFAQAPADMNLGTPDTLVTYMFNQAALASEFFLERRELEAADADLSDFKVRIEASRNFNEQMVRDNYGYAFAQQALLDLSISLPKEVRNVMPILVNPIGTEIQYGMSFDNMQLLNILFYYAHPEYAR